MSPDMPAWNAADPAASLLAQSAWLNERAREAFLKDGTHVELFFLYKADGEGAIIPPQPGVDRDAFLAVLKESIREHGVYGVIHIVEAWSYFPRRPNDHTMRQVAEGELAVSDLKPEDRTEVLMVRCEARDGVTRMWLNPILRPPDGLALADPLESTDPPGGRYAGLFGDDGGAPPS